MTRLRWNWMVLLMTIGGLVVSALVSAAIPQADDIIINNGTITFVIKHMSHSRVIANMTAFQYGLLDRLHRRSNNGRRSLQGRRPPIMLPLVSGYHLESGGYYAQPMVGSKRRFFYLSVDTGTDLSWMQCQPCALCHPQINEPIFTPGVDSTTLSVVSGGHLLCALLREHATSRPDSPLCSYTISYMDGATTSGTLVTDTFTLAGASLPSIAFGCSSRSEGFLGINSAGILGLARGPLSFPSQLRRRNIIHPSTLSFCLPPMYSPSTSTLTFGTPQLSPTTLFTPLLTNPAAPLFYYVPLMGISVAETLLSQLSPSLFRIDPETGHGGTYLDTNAAVTRLHPVAYQVLRDTMKAAIASDAPHLILAHPYVDLLDTCYLPKSEAVPYDRLRDGVPSVSIHFGGANLELSPDQVLMPLGKPGKPPRQASLPLLHPFPLR
ncbi:hypothetical protein L7F22_055568 [Adiantum nelumboides]|nr:hypothetical protein [Adiantum nelumboides]